MIDIGLNITNKIFSNNIGEELEFAKNQGVNKIIFTGTTAENSQLSKLICQQYPQYNLYYTIGTHPHKAKHANIQYQENDTINAIAIGETGLDFFRMLSPKQTQLDIFEAHILLAKKYNKPLFIHDRGASLDVLNILANSNTKGIVHCFTEGADLAKKYLDLGLFLGFTGWITDTRRNQKSLEALKYCPLDRILLETDAPYLTPFNINNRPSNNKCGYLGYIYDFVSHQKSLPKSELITLTNKNFETLFLNKENI